MPFSVAQNVARLRRLGGAVVTKGAQSTYGIFDSAPAAILDGASGRAAVQGADATVVVAAGTLTGVAADEGVGLTVTVDGEDWRICAIGTPEGENGDLLQLGLTRAR